jgi:hypothetical protein
MEGRKGLDERYCCKRALAPPPPPGVPRSSVAHIAKMVASEPGSTQVHASSAHNVKPASAFPTPLSVAKCTPVTVCVSTRGQGGASGGAAQWGRAVPRAWTEDLMPHFPPHPLTRPPQVAGLHLGTTHRGRLLRGRLIVEALPVTGIYTVLEDEEGNAVHVGPLV